MRRAFLALLCAALLGTCGCTVNGVPVDQAQGDGAQPSGAQPLDMTDHQRASDEPPNVQEVSYGCASIEVPRDWDVFDDPDIESAIVYAPYHASVSLLGHDSDIDIDFDEVAENHRSLVYEAERDGDEVVRDECATDGDTMRISTVYIHEDDGTTYQYWQNAIYSDGGRADLIGSIDESCTDAQKAEFAWVMDSLRLTDGTAGSDGEPSNAKPVSTRLVEQFPVEVDLDGITFRVPKAGDGWESPDYVEKPKNVNVSVWYNPPDQEDNFGVVNLIKSNVNPASVAHLAELGTGRSDSDYINAAIDYIDESGGSYPETVHDASEWEVRRDPGGVVCSCHMNEYLDPSKISGLGSQTLGVNSFIFTDHGSYVFNSSFTTYDAGLSKPEDTSNMYLIADTLRVN